MAEPFLSEIRLMSFNFAPKGWAECNGQLLPINQNQALFALLGTMYGGDGRVNFALPDLRGRVPMHLGNGHTQGERAGEEIHTVSLSEMPTHLHQEQATSTAGTLPSAAGNMLAKAQNQYVDGVPAPTTLAPASITSVGGSQPHENRMPHLT